MKKRRERRPVDELAVKRVLRKIDALTDAHPEAFTPENTARLMKELGRQDLGLRDSAGIERRSGGE